MGVGEQRGHRTVLVMSKRRSVTLAQKSSTEGNGGASNGIGQSVGRFADKSKAQHKTVILSQIKDNRSSANVVSEASGENANKNDNVSESIDTVSKNGDQLTPNRPSRRSNRRAGNTSKSKSILLTPKLEGGT